MSRRDNAAIIVDLRIIVTGTKGTDDPIDAIHQAIREMLKRRVAATKASGACVVYGVEGMEPDEPVNLPSGGTVSLKWTGLELTPDQDDAVICKVLH